MIETCQMQCTERNEVVDVMVEVKNAGKASESRNCLNCMQMLQCDPALFCKFVNPLSNRNPLAESQPA